MSWALLRVSEQLREMRRRDIMPLLLEMFDVGKERRKSELYDDEFVLDMDRCCGPGALVGKILCLP
jgi:hypothetical protein